MNLYEASEDSNLILKQVPGLVKKGMRALDVGAGSGVIVEALLKQTSNVTGADVNPYAIDYCSKKFKKAKFIQSNLFDNIKNKFESIN